MSKFIQVSCFLFLLLSESISSQGMNDSRSLVEQFKINLIYSWFWTFLQMRLKLWKQVLVKPKKKALISPPIVLSLKEAYLCSSNGLKMARKLLKLILKSVQLMREVPSLLSEKYLHLIMGIILVMSGITTEMMITCFL